MDTSSDSDGPPRSPGVYGRMAYTAAVAGHGDSVIVVESPSRHSESSGSGGGGGVDESRTKAHHKFSIDRILGRFGGGGGGDNVASAAVDSTACPVADTSSDPDKSHGGNSELASRGAAGEWTAAVVNGFASRAGFPLTGFFLFFLKRAFYFKSISTITKRHKINITIHVKR